MIKKVLIVKKDEIGKVSGQMMLDEIKKNPSIVLGLPTGETAEATYKFLSADHKANKTDWSKVTTFNLDEYVGLDVNDQQSYAYYMKTKLYDNVNLKPENCFIPKGKGDYLAYAKKYDQLIKEHGGLDLQLVPLGRNGHIAYNEPGSSFKSQTRLIKLTQNTIEANSRFFKSPNDVPREAISMGVESIMKAKKLIVIAYGENKAFAIKELLEGKVSENVPCTVMQNHPDVVVIIDEPAASQLTNKNFK